MSISFRYPVLEGHVCTKNFRCSYCGSVVEKGNKYYRTNHGRYCPKCLKRAQRENAHGGTNTVLKEESVGSS